MAVDMQKSFADYKANGHTWITLASGEYYPDILEDACKLYQPVLEMFGQLLKTSESSIRLFLQISEIGFDLNSEAEEWRQVFLKRSGAVTEQHPQLATFQKTHRTYFYFIKEKVLKGIF